MPPPLPCLGGFLLGAFSAVVAPLGASPAGNLAGPVVFLALGGAA